MSIKSIIKNNKLTANIYKIIRQHYYDLYWGSFVKNKNEHNDVVFYEGYCKTKGHSLDKANWGDDLNCFFFEYITNRKFYFVPFTQMSDSKCCVHYSLIGSILGYFNLDNTIVYGSGVIDENMKFVGTPNKIISVRGPKSREVLLKNGYDCPEYYGDPALLLSCFYKPELKKSGKGILIANMGTSSDNQVVNSLISLLNLDLLDMTSYNCWTDVIDRIIESEFVISESLHGLIVAETYGIPNVWVEFKDHPSYWNFKFEDYYKSINKNESIIRLQEDIDINLIMNKINSWSKGKIDYSSMLNNLPFEIQTQFKGIYNGF